MEKQKINKQEKILMWTIALLVLGYLIIGYLVFWGFNDYKQCSGNPFTYGAEKISSYETGDLFCTCTFSNPHYAPFYFDSEEVAVLLGS